jgi:hypothetical protein
MRPLQRCKHTGEEIAKIIKESLEEARIPIECMVVYVTDNASNATKSVRELGINPANHHKCVAHILNLVVQKFIRWKTNDEDRTILDDELERLKTISELIGYLDQIG